MSREELTKYFRDYLQKCKSYNLDQIYNEVEKDEKYPFFLQFIQLKEYYNFRKEFLDNLNSGNLPDPAASASDFRQYQHTSSYRQQLLLH